MHDESHWEADSDSRDSPLNVPFLGYQNSQMTLATGQNERKFTFGPGRKSKRISEASSDPAQFENNMLNQLAKHIRQKVISAQRLEYPENQHISMTKIDQMQCLMNQPKAAFKNTLSNLIFSANNPFQSDFDYVVDQTYLRRMHAKLHINYGTTTSLGYLVHQQH